MVRVLFRDIFLIVIGLGLFGTGCVFAGKSAHLQWLGAAAAILGGLLFLFGFTALVALLWRIGCLGMA